MVKRTATLAQTVNGRERRSIPDQVVTEGRIREFTVVNRSHPHLTHAVLLTELLIRGGGERCDLVVRAASDPSGLSSGRRPPHRRASLSPIGRLAAAAATSG